MQKIITMMILGFIIATTFIFPQKKINPSQSHEDYKITSKSGEVIIPFEMYRNKIRMKAVINNKECFLTMDNGSLWDELLFFGSAKTDSIGFVKTKKIFIGDSAAVNPLEADLSTEFTFNFRDIVFTNQKAIITRYIKGRPNLWEGIDGQVSATFFRNFIVEINYDSSFVRLIKPGEFIIDDNCQELKMEKSSFDSRTINAIISTLDGAKLEISLLIDFGGIYPLYLPVGKYDEIKLPSNAVNASLGSNILGANSGYLGRVQSIKLGKYSLENVITAFMPADKKSDVYGTTMIGMPLLMRFNVFFDYPNEKIILKPSSNFKMPFKFNMTGFTYFPDRQGNLKVNEVYPNSPALLNGIKAGDIIIRVNGKEILSYSPTQLRELLMNEGQTVKITFKGESGLKEASIVLKQIL